MGVVASEPASGPESEAASEAPPDARSPAGSGARCRRWRGAAAAECGDSLPSMVWSSGSDALDSGTAGVEPEALHDEVAGGAAREPLRDEVAGVAEPDLAQDDAVTDSLDVEEYRELLRSAEQVLDGVDRALAQLNEGTYGLCAACGEPIDEVRLEADPTAQRCTRHDLRA